VVLSERELRIPVDFPSNVDDLILDPSGFVKKIERGLESPELDF
jgi:hypothetical protein